MTAHYVSLAGLEQITRELSGDETMGIGIRPFGFHAGNMTSIVAYPILLCEAMDALGKVPAFNIHCWFNDIEQYGVVGHYSDPIHQNEANIYPAGRTLQFTPAPGQFPGTVVDYWAPLIKNGVMEIQKRFPSIHLTFHKTSDLRTLPTFRSAVIQAIQSRDFIADLTQEHLHKTVHRPAEFVRAICPDCKTPVKDTQSTHEDKISIDCADCGTRVTADVADFDWWLQHRILTMPKLSVGPGFDIWMMGYDHFQEKETTVREALAEKFNITAKNYTAIHAPLILSYDGRKMGKSNHNVAYVPLEGLLDLLRKNEGPEIGIGQVSYSRDVCVLGDLVPSHIRQYAPR
jgi:lysyl-tRNA synthetase class I